MLMHLINETLQPERRGSSWRQSIVNAGTKLQDHLQDSPSLRRLIEEELEPIYRRAAKAAIYEMNLPPEKQAQIPERCPYTLEELLESYPRPWR